VTLVVNVTRVGGLELVDVQTIHIEKLSDQLIAPSLDEDISFFYDPVTRKLRKRFARYPNALQTEAEFFHELERADTPLLHQIQAEQKRYW
jgi:hypothetical protein